MQALIWTSFEWKKRHEEAVVDENAVLEDNILAEGDDASKEEKPPVLRGDSGESIQTKESESMDEGRVAEERQTG